MGPRIISFSLSGIVACLFVLVGYAAVDLVPCDKSRRVFTSSWGLITDGPSGSNYTPNSHCEWLIKANNSKQFISLSFSSMGTECSYDYVFVYDGDSFRSPLLGSFSGKTEPQQVIASSGYMLILLYSDTNYVLEGFKAEFSVTNCPNNCSNHGVCFDHHCVCENDWGGNDCSHRLCQDDCGHSQGRGHCHLGQCICYTGYSGRSCSLNDNDPAGNKWHWLSHTEGGLVPRAAHTAVYLESTDSLYVFGGYDLNRVLGALEIYSFRNSTWHDSGGQQLVDKSLQSSFDPASIGSLLEQVGPVWEERWGLNSKISFLRTVLLSVSDNTPYETRKQRHSHLSDPHKPSPRYGHAACSVSHGFVIYGGKLDNGSISNELWLYNVLTRRWELRAKHSAVKPYALTRHTLTAAGEVLYLFGGSTADGEFSSKLYRTQLMPGGAEEWEIVNPRGGKELDVRVVAHSTVYLPTLNSLLVYGGVVAGVANFSKLSDRMFAFQLDSRHWTEFHYTREHLRERFVPRERAFHTASILGNYLIVFGGYSHRHNTEEICYDNQMYLYHLGCHTWVNPEILGKTTDSSYPKHQGVFAHASSVRKGNTLLLVGGYHGNVNGDLLAYTVPPMVAAREGDSYDPEAVCPRHRNYAECSADPECGWCSSDELCYGRTVGANCTTNLQTTRCPGVCPALGDCHACLIHGRSLHGARPLVSAAHKLGLGDCTWCVQNARCHHKDDNFGVCGLREDSPSQKQGWWGPKGTEVLKPNECRELDRRPGLTFLLYHHPVNWSQPDHVAIINATTVDFSSQITSHNLRTDLTGSGEMVARLLGFLRPPTEWQDMLQICVSHCIATLRIDNQLLANLSAELKKCQPHPWPDNSSTSVFVDFESHKTVSSNAHNTHQQSKMELQHYRDNETPKVFTFEYLEPFANGTCGQYSNCLYCLTDSHCGWCEATNQCVSRLEDESITCTLDGDWRYLTLQPSACSNCSNFISCESCLSTGLCEWWVEDARCSRRGRALDAVTNLEQCPTPCYLRQDCSACFEQRGRCVWCEATQQCFSFFVYTSEYQFGLCREWLDQAFPRLPPHEEALVPVPRPQDQCKSCTHHANCSTCLSSLSCGWCYNPSNPITGMCVQGDFNHPHSNCQQVLNLTTARWSYAHCPDVDECGLGLHDCHSEAICTNTDGSFSCHCRRGFIGDGRTSCVRTCYNVCIHGVCQGEPDYSCHCKLGWTGADCSENCGCNNHSRCSKGVGVCDQCEHWTTGDRCELCLPGSYGNASTEQGCHQCECNGHDVVGKGSCDIVTGKCYCQDNTEGDKCERCKDTYYGDPRLGGQCYYQCEARGMLYGNEGQGISSRQAYSAPWGGPPIRECLWIINPQIEGGGTAIIQLQMNSSQLNISCGENAVYVYDGLPELADIGSQTALAAVFCTEEARPSTIVESRSGQLTVHYKQGLAGEGFNAMYKVLHCDDCEPPRKCKHGQCVCPDGLVGSDCSDVICPDNCTSGLGQGVCDKAYGRCLCSNGYGGPSCDLKLTDSNLVFVELFDTVHLADQYEHLRKTLPRFGHSLAADRRGSLWMFGGYSLSHGPLNDIRLFDTRNSTWMQITVDSTPDAKMPQGRYFHAADIVQTRQTIYIYGGLTRGKASANKTLSDFWQFDIQNQRWIEFEKTNIWPPAVAGHTLTSYRNSSSESLILIGGVSPQDGFLTTVWEFRLDVKQWQAWETRGVGPIGIYSHSTVFHSPSNSLYIFGGYEYTDQRAVLSNHLYMLHCDSHTWTNLNSYTSSPLSIPRARFLHTAVTTDTHMLLLGGRLHPWNVTDTLYAYSYNCNQWINLISDGIDKVGPLPGQSYALAMALEPEGGAAYVVGGWGSDSQCSVLRLIIPQDLCLLWNTRRYCLQSPGCGHCSWKLPDSIAIEKCHSNLRQGQCPEAIENGTKTTNNGKMCDSDIITGECSSLTDCSSCTQASGCQWCDGSCTANKTCSKTGITTRIQCPSNICIASDCQQCQQLKDCHWLKQTNLCVAEVAGNEHHHQADNATCPKSCSQYSTCSKCLDNFNCRWSTKMDECLAQSYQSMYCAGGVCGLVLRKEDRQHCPEPCSSFTQCATCLRHAYCGWCAQPGIRGIGVCTEGSNDRPMSGTCEAIYESYHQSVQNEPETFPLQTLDVETELAVINDTFSWHYVKCPPEDECSNNHHHCKANSELCVDLDVGFDCICGPGYRQSFSGCEPVCSLGCVRGQCIQPNNCLCDFGYVGANCSIQCQCNGHANCAGPDKLKDCLQCHNNTMGLQCEKCEPLYVGDPTDGGQCIPCLEYCNGHTSVCVDSNSTQKDPPEGIGIDELRSYLKEGPVEAARCVRCTNKTAGSRCDECIVGTFRGSEDHRDPCRPCDCHGHGDTCDPVTGEKCNCKNNTESDTSCQTGASGKNSAHTQPCWTVQCAKCKESYMGSPTGGHQCYKQMTVDSKMCFDAKLIDECKMKPKPLHPGEMVFFVVQPRFMNVDIRIMIDVTQGSLNVYISTHDDTYVVTPNSTTGMHDIELDTRYGRWDNGSFKTTDVHLEKPAKGLSTYITVRQPNTLFTLRGLQDRLVITLPEEYHSLETTRFYLVLQALGSPDSAPSQVSYGMVFFRQDQLHIDLFVFFSVFFSCFFLFLAACVVAWKAKQAADVRRARRRHVVEMLHMAKRPFASVTVQLNQRPKIRRSPHHDLRPIAVEPTDDGLAAVATVFVSLPGGQNATVRLALASSLILLARQFPSGGRTFLRRRSTHAVPPT